MGDLKALVQNIMRLRGIDEGGLTRAIIVGGSSMEMKSSFGDLATIHSGTEYQGMVPFLTTSMRPR
jgi:hypothetical protein